MKRLHGALAVVLLFAAVPGARAEDAPLMIEGPESTMDIFPGDVASVTLGELSGQPVVLVQLEPAVQAELADLATGHIGQEVVFRFCGAELARPRLRSALDEGRFTLGGPLNGRGPEIVSILQGRTECQFLAS